MTLDIETTEGIVWEVKPGIRQVTPRAIVAGLVIGTIVLISNFQFGLQTGWVSMMSLPSALLAFAIFKRLQDHLSYKFTDVENVFIQSIAVAVGTGPLAYGFVGVIPAIEKFLTKEESGTGQLIEFSLKELIIWSAGLGFFGIYFAVPLRKQVIIKENLPFPSGSATATLISVLHNTEIRNTTVDKGEIDRIEIDEGFLNSSNDEEDNDHNGTHLNTSTMKEFEREVKYNANIKSLITTFSISSSYTLISYFVPGLKDLPIFGSTLANKYLWTFQPSPAYIGQGMIMGLSTVSYMLFGALLGWGVLSPLAKYKGWAPGNVDDWKTGSQGWIMWISLAVMISDSVISFVIVVSRSLWKFYKDRLRERNDREIESLLEDSADDEIQGEVIQEIEKKYLVGSSTVIVGLIGSSVLCIASFMWLFKPVISVLPLIFAVILAMFLSILGVRALGETDLNPVSGIGKLSQLLFTVIIPKNQPGAVLINLIAGAIAEAGAQQAGDLMQDLKTGHLIGASPKAQYIAQIIGTLWSVVLSSVMYRAYNAVYEIPSKTFRIPTSTIWIDCSRLVTGQGLPPLALEYSLIFGLIFGIISFFKNVFKHDRRFNNYLKWLPSGVAVGIGIYNTPSFTIARFIGGLFSHIWLQKAQDGKISMIVFSSGLILGEGIFSIVSMTLASLKIPHF